MATTFDVTTVRSQFPALNQKQVFMDNAGGSQVLSTVIDSISTYYSTNNVQLGASYPIAQKSTKLFSEGHQAGAKYINASPEEVVFGPATTQLFRNLSIALKIEPGSEIVLSNLDHEANLAPWVQLAEWKKLTVKWWIPTQNTTSNPKLEPDDLKKLVTPKTRLVCCTHTSNILGTVTDVRSLVESHTRNQSRHFILASTPWRTPHTVQSTSRPWEWISILFFSWYKVYGPPYRNAVRE